MDDRTEAAVEPWPSLLEIATNATVAAVGYKEQLVTANSILAALLDPEPSHGLTMQHIYHELDTVGLLVDGYIGLTPTEHAHLTALLEDTEADG